MHKPTRTLVTACVLAAALLVAGCGVDKEKDQVAPDRSSGEVFLVPVAAQGPDPFTDTTVTPPSVTRIPQPASTGTASAAQGVRSVSGATPGLYGGIQNAGSCDVEKQIGFLAADRSKARAFARASGNSQAAIPDYLRGLTSVVLRADTRVTNHGYGDGRVTSFQSVLQEGTAVLVDNRGVPRVRCASGNPLNPPVPVRGDPVTQGKPWAGWPSEVVVVTPAPTVITTITIIDIADNTWIERRIGDDGRQDHAVLPPDGSEPDCVTPTETDTGPDTGTETGAPRATESAPDPATDFGPPLSDAARLGSSAGCPTATVPAPPATEPDSTPSSPVGTPRSVDAPPDVFDS
ncbi:MULTISPECIES: DUF6777 domain-containing protein [Streptomyces]|uniref:DUF6777 domain-containing protein n=1 Tax=Streptomyces TaxID=1883 RepID=UPI000C4744BB|nr:MULTISPECIES: DUF6777 domain-containing protein [Streptomyces]PIB08452.1 hypothetical protein B1C81_15900 [Streptomyces sp. HG99]